MLFGIDYSAWAVGPQFMGIKLIPPGLHYIYSGASAAEDVGIGRTGFFLYMKPKDGKTLDDRHGGKREGNIPCLN